ncbi:MAG: PKD domain-containing protein, partial [Flavobacteriales bacterium]|nr:PKD domain-containing protein [Flavobacteriales bacterium]
EVFTDFIEIYNTPVVNFSSDIQSGCYPLCIQLTDETISDANIIEWNWDFGNGEGSTGQNPNYCYDTPGVYSPILSVENEFGCFSNITLDNYITVLDEFPVASFNPSTLSDCNPPSVLTFQNESTGQGQLTSTWDFDNGFSSTTIDASDVQHTFDNVNNYNVCLNIVDETGCSADTCIPIEIFAAPLPEFTVSSNLNCAQTGIDFISTTSPTPTSLSWDFDGDGIADASDQDSINFAYPIEGIYNPTLTAIYSPGCEATTDGSEEIEILEELIPAFSADTTFGCTVPLDIEFTNASTGNGTLTYSWLINGAEVSTAPDFTYTFTALGSYDVELVVFNDSGCEAHLLMESYVNLNSTTIDFNLPTVVCTEELVELTSFDVNSYDAVELLEWDFDNDGSIDAIGDQPGFTYLDPGEYTVSVDVTTENGCYSTVESDVSILVQPNAEAEILSGPTMSCAGEPVEFCVETVEGLNYNWNFGDNTGWSLIEYPETCVLHDYQDTGYFDITLSVFNLACGTQLVLEDYLYITGPVAMFSAEEDCALGTVVTFTDNSIEAEVLVRDFGDGS